MECGERRSPHSRCRRERGVDRIRQRAFYALSVHGGAEGYVGELFVKTPWRGKGIGGELLRGAVNESKKRCCCRIRLINIRSRESYRRGFYSKQGWQERNRCADFMLRLNESNELRKQVAALESNRLGFQ